MTEKQHIIGIIGGGMMTQVGHLPFLIENPRCRVKSIAESRPSLVKYIQSTYNFDGLKPHHREILDDPEIDTVILSAPRPATGPLTLECLEAGKHILAEKPMAHSVEQAEKLVKAAQAKNLVYEVGFMKRYDPGLQKAKVLFKKFLKTQELGSLLSANFYNHSKSYAHQPVPVHQRPQESREERFSIWPLFPDWIPQEHQNRFAWFMNSASHDVNLIHYFFEESPEVLSTVISNNDSVASIMKHEDALITLNISKAEAGEWIEGAELVFEKGRLVFQIPSPMNVEGVSRVVLHENADKPSRKVIETDTGWSFERQISGFLDILDGKKETGTTGENGLQDMQLIEKIWQKGVKT